MAGAVGSTPAHLLLREATRDAHEAAEATAGMRLLLAGELDDRGYAGLLRAQLGLFDAWEAGRRDWLAGLTEWRYVSRAALIEADLSAAAPIADESAPTQDMRRRSVGADFVGDESTPTQDPHRRSVGADFVGDESTPTQDPHRRPVGADVVGDESTPTQDPRRRSVGADFVGDESTPTQDPHRRSVGADFVGDEAAYWGELYVVEGSALGGRVIVRRLRELYPELPHHFYAVGENAPAGWRRFQSLLDRALPDEASQEAATLGAQRMFARFQQMLKDPAAHD